MSSAGTAMPEFTLHLQDLRPVKARAGAIVEAAEDDCHLVHVNDRTFYIPSRIKGWPGIAGAFFASERRPAEDLDKIMAYVEGVSSSGFYPDEEVPPVLRRVGGWPTQDPELRAKVEAAAVNLVIAYYKDRGWKVKSVEKENSGWDLDVTKSGRSLRVEVKGRGGQGSVELTPNEYDAMRDKKRRMSYRIMIVHNALTASPVLTAFEYAPASDTWISDSGAKLTLIEKTGASVSF